MSLFQTDAWQSAWWETWGPDNELELIRSWGDGRTGIYSSTYHLKGFIPVRSTEFVGGSYRKFRSTRTEYNSFCSFNDTPAAAIEQLKNVMDSHSWGEAVFNDLVANSDEVSELIKLAHNRQWLIRETAADTAWQVHTDQSFDAYLTTLGRNTRLRLYNRRSVLESLGEVTLENMYDSTQRDPNEFFAHLNDFHQRRWGKPVYGQKALAFNTAFLERVIKEGGEPRLLALRSAGQLISVLYNVKYQSCIYNLQSGFEENLHPKLAVGTLHLGYAIEEAFREEGVYRFDMLAGSGKNENFKQRLATGNEPLVSLMLVKHPVLKLLYRLKDGS
jgi:Acetyltransferase (GNAT) domain